MKIISAGATNSGKRRDNNEDALLLDDGQHLYAVADGVGGSEGGEVASRIAVETIAGKMNDLLASVNRTPPRGRSSDSTTEFSMLRSLMDLTNRNVRLAREESASLSNMATTLTLLLLRQRLAYVAHVGDSRAYVLRSGELSQLTDDHTFVGEQVRAGLLTPEQAHTSAYRHVITRAVGIEEEVKTDVLRYEMQQDDRFLLCTDGLTEMVSDKELGRVLAASEPNEAVQKLIAAANDAGGVDNITAIVLWITEV